MTQRKYSIAEIDRMRWAIRKRYPMIWTNHNGFGTPRLTAEFDQLVEEELRTHMLNGTDPEEIEAAPPHPDRTGITWVEAART